MRRGPAIINESMAVNIASPAFLFAYTSLISFQTIITGTPVGTLKLQVSNDLTDNKNSVITWNDLTGSDIAVTTADNHVYNLRDLSTKWIRIVYIATSGSGFLSANFYSIVES